MLVGAPKEIKNHEYRVGLTPESAHEVVAHGHRVLIETGAGSGIGASDADYRAAGAEIAANATQIYGQAELIVKVKEPQAVERQMLRPGQVLFTYLHLAPDAEQTRDLIKSGVAAIAYETVTDRVGGLPLLTPMSQVAGRLAVQAGAYCLERAHGGRGMLLGGVPGVAPARIAILGGGIVGANAVQIAVGVGADVAVLDRNVEVLERLSQRFGAALTTLYASRAAVDRAVVNADLVIGAVLVKGARAPHLISRDMVRRMQAGAVLVDVAIDQGGCAETSKPTTHAEPTYMVDGVVHYCVANMPGAVPRTSTYALNNVTLPFVLALADKGWRRALAEDRHLREGLNIAGGRVACGAVAEAHGLEHVPADILLAA